MDIHSEPSNRRYERIKVDRHWVDPTIQRNTKWAEEDPRDCPPNNLGTTLSMQLSSIFHVAAGYYLADEIEKSREWGRRLIRAGEEYFFGDWRQSMPNNPYHPEEDGLWANGGGGWVTEYRTAVAFALALDDIASAKHLSAFPTDKWETHKDRCWYLLLAEYILQGTNGLYEQRLIGIRGGTAKGHKVFAECLDAIAGQHTAEINQRFADLMKFYLQRQKGRDEMEFKLALDGTILYQLARRQGHEIVMDDFTRDHLIIFN